MDDDALHKIVQYQVRQHRLASGRIGFESDDPGIRARLGGKDCIEPVVGADVEEQTLGSENMRHDHDWQRRLVGPRLHGPCNHVGAAEIVEYKLPAGEIKADAFRSGRHRRRNLAGGA